MNLSAVTASSTVSGGVGSRSNASQIADPPSLSKVHKNYADLQDLLANLPSKLNRVSNQVDKEFLSSYRVHMLSIQTELKNLKHDVTKGEQLLNSDATVAKLEAEAKWFADECGRLRHHHDSMFKDCEQIKQRLKAMKEQKVFLSEQLKALMKRNKILQVEIDSAVAADLSSQSSIGGSAKLLTAQPTAKLSERGKERSRGQRDIHHEPLRKYSIEGNSEEDDEYFRPSADYMDDVSDLEAFSHIIEDEQGGVKKPFLGLSESMPNLSVRVGDRMAVTTDRLNKTSSPKFLKKKVLSEDRLLQTASLPPHHLRHSNSAKKLESNRKHPFNHKKSTSEELEDLQSKRKDIELLLEHSIREIFSEISQRKQHATQLSSTRLPSMSSSMKRTDVSPAPSPHNEFPEAASPLNRTSTREKSARPALDHHLRVEPHIKSSGGITGLGLDQFSDNDRFAAVVKFLANPHVFQQVVGGLLDRYEL
eukprot:gene8396-9082_t